MSLMPMVSPYVVAGVIPDLVLKYTFQEGAGTTVADDSPNGNTGTLTNMDNSNWVTGPGPGYSLTFDGTTEYVNAGQPGVNANYTCMVRAKSTGGVLARLFALRYNSIGGSSWQRTNCILSWTATNKAQLTQVSGTAARSLASTETLSTSTYQWIIGSYDGANMRVYIDAVESSGGPLASGSPRLDTPQYLNIGRDPGSASLFLSGEVAEVRYYSRALTQTELDAIVAGTA